jgi:hypothetical protein
MCWWLQHQTITSVYKIKSNAMTFALLFKWIMQQWPTHYKPYKGGKTTHIVWQWLLCYIGCKGSQNNNNKTQYDGPRFIAQINNMAIIVVLPKEIKILETCNMVMATILLHIIQSFKKKPHTQCNGHQTIIKCGYQFLKIICITNFFNHNLAIIFMWKKIQRFILFRYGCHAFET